MGIGDIGKILPSDLYLVDTSHEFSLSYTKSLTHLYQPLIGIDALSLYQTLYTESTLSFSSASVQTHHMLMNYIGLPLDRLYRARKKLEAIGLLQTFEEEDEDIKVYHYLLHPPHAAQQFFENDFLSHLLYHQLGTEKFKKVKQAFVRESEPSTDKEETTARFEEVFQLVKEKDVPADLLPQQEAKEVPMEEKVDFEWLGQILKQRMLPVEKILTAKGKTLINQMAVLYHLTNQEIEKALIWSINEEKDFLFNEFKEACLYISGGEKQHIALNIASEKQKISVQQTRKAPKSREERFIEMLERKSPKEVLEDLADGNQASQQDLKIISDVMTSQGLNPGVMNVLIHYVLLKTDMKLSRSYLEKIASHWARKNVKSVRQAMTLAKSENKKYQQWSSQSNRNYRYSYKQTKKDIVPEWYKKQKQQAKQNNQHEETSQTEKEQKAREADALLAQYLAQQANDD